MKPSLERGLQVMREVVDAPIASFFSSCVSCGICAEVCHVYSETGETKYIPINKLKPLEKLWASEYTLLGKLKSLVGMADLPDADEMEEWSLLAYDGCSLCGRCTLACPVGNDITGMIRKFREGLAASGNAPENLIGATRRTIDIGSPMGVTFEAVQAKISHAEKAGGLPIPVDQVGAEYLVILSSMEIMYFSEIFEALAKIFDHAGVSWTMSSKAYEGTNSGIQIGVSDLARQIVQRTVDEARRLQVKTVITPECGHASTALRWEGPNLIGQKLDFEVKHMVEVLEALRLAGKLKTVSKESVKVTYHDPCQIARRGGIIQEPRNLVKMISEDFEETPETGLYNWCCGGGGGVSAIERTEELRVKVFAKKIEQFDAVGAEKLITACANCRTIMEEGLEEYDKELEVVSLTELVAEQLPDPKTQDA
ncbi:(Fe-S)-binding protein [Magnetococcus sp. PR-3]|uniref:(Fe-S)-binding protein n=1 Tax=Magnetococcus sp. PR-3 TaxID=3120355 RepID=UPI002FCE3C5D